MRKLRRLIRSCCGKVLLQLTVHSVGFLSRIRTRSLSPQTKVASTPPHVCHIVLPGRQVPADPRKPAHLRRPAPTPSEGDHLRAASQKRGLPRQFPGGADLRGGGARGIRTPDLLIANETRYQLRHSPKGGPILASPPGVLASSVAVSPPTAPEPPADGTRERPALLAGRPPPLEDGIEVDGVEELLLILHRSGNVAAADCGRAGTGAEVPGSTTGSA